jgi:hypothetical protein
MICVRKPNYVLTFSLHKVCSHDGMKKVMIMEKNAIVFKLNSSSLQSPYFSCHLDLLLPSANYGVSVFIEEMLFSGFGSDCSEDFLQFGRDILFVTSHLSGKYCGTLVRPNKETYLTVPSFSTAQRNYVEEYDSEMDIWIHIKVAPNQTAQYKTLLLIVTPFRQSCNPRDSKYIQCGQARACVEKELWCDGRGNCPSSGGAFAGEVILNSHLPFHLVYNYICSAWPRLG